MTDCAHQATELRVRRGVAGRLVQRQCPSCREGIGESVPYSAFPAHEALKLKTWALNQKPNSRRREYGEYLKSAEWKALRLLVLDRDGYLCQPCARQGFEHGATDAGHLSYDRFGEEMLSDLEAQCRACNADERLARITRPCAASTP